MTILNAPDILTFSRLVLTVPFVIFLFVPGMEAQFFALLFFFAGSATDYFDGKIARLRNLKSDFGALMDPIADKVLTLSAFVAFAARGLFPWWGVVLIAGREVALTILRLRWAGRGRVVSARWSGKLKTAFQMITIIGALMLGLLRAAINESDHVVLYVLTCERYLALLTQLFFYTAVVITLYSGWQLIKNYYFPDEKRLSKK